jgi:deoxyribonuclease V
MKVRDLHSWDLSYTEAIALQKKLARRVKAVPLSKTPRLIAGVDCAFTRDGTSVIACIVVISLSDLKPVEIQWAIQPLKFPYIPGLLSFREAPACIAAARKLENTPDVIVVDGQGIAHPRRLGIASHLGLVLARPSFGCAKSRLTGTCEEPGTEQGDWSPLMDGPETIGVVLRTKAGVKPVFLSVGHRITLDESIEICLSAVSRYRLPEPTRLADLKVAELKRTLAGSSGT